MNMLVHMVHTQHINIFYKCRRRCNGRRKKGERSDWMQCSRIVHAPARASTSFICGNLATFAGDELPPQILPAMCAYNHTFITDWVRECVALSPKWQLSCQNDIQMWQINHILSAFWQEMCAQTKHWHRIFSFVQSRPVQWIGWMK